MNLLDNYLASRRLEEQYQDMDIDTFGDEMLEEVRVRKIKNGNR